MAPWWGGPSLPGLHRASPGLAAPPTSPGLLVQEPQRSLREPISARVCNTVIAPGGLRNQGHCQNGNSGLHLALKQL